MPFRRKSNIKMNISSKMPFSSICSWPKLLPKRQQNVGKKFHGIQPRKGVKNGEKMMMRAENNPEKRLKMVTNWWWERKKLWKNDDESVKNGEKLMMRVEPVADVRSGLLQSNDAAGKGSRLEIIWTGRKGLDFWMLYRSDLYWRVSDYIFDIL